MMKLEVVELMGRTWAFISLLSLCHPGSATSLGHRISSVKPELVVSIGPSHLPNLLILGRPPPSC